jgi:glycosyltransferase involved in cell wall biosynthesis
MAFRSRRAKVVHLITRLELGGAQQNTLYCVLHHDRARFEVGLVAGEGGLLDSKAREIPDADVVLVPWLRHAIAPLHDAFAIPRLARRLAGVDLVHTHSSKAGILGRAAARLAGVGAVVHTVHGWSFNAFQPSAQRRLYVALERAAAGVTDRLICVSSADRELGLRSRIGEPSRYRIVRSGIDPTAFAPAPGARERAREALGFAPGTVVVGTIANLKPQKAPLDFVEAARLALARDPSLRFVFAGDGELRPEVERAIARAGLGGSVLLLGWREDVADVLAALDVFLLTSLFEGLPRSVLQAIAAERPVVVTDTGGTAEIVENGVTGFLVPPGDPAAAAAAVVALAGDPALRARFAASARGRLGDEFDVGRMVREVEAIYDELLNGTPSTTRAATSSSHLGVTLSNH